MLLDTLTRSVHINLAKHGSMVLHLDDYKILNSVVNHVEGISLAEIPVACEYPDVFPDDLPGISSDRDVEFAIELQLGTAPFSRRQYRMPPTS